MFRHSPLRVWQRIKGTLGKGWERQKTKGLKECLEELSKLQLQIKALRIKKISYLDLFELKSSVNTNASLYHHIECLLIKIKECLLVFCCRQDQFSQEVEILERKEFLQTEQACRHCYHTIFSINQLLKHTENISFKKLRYEVSILELETEVLLEAIHALTKFSNRREVALQLLLLKKEENSSFKEVQSISDKEYLRFINRVIEAYEILRSYYVVSRRTTIKEDLDNMRKNIEMLISDLSESNREAALFHLNEIFNRIESLRFSTNNENRCSRYLFEKSKEVRRQLRKACVDCDVGRMLLGEIAFNKNKPV